MSFLEYLLALNEDGLEGMLENGDWTNINVFSSKLKELFYFAKPNSQLEVDFLIQEKGLPYTRADAWGPGSVI